MIWPYAYACTAALLMDSGLLVMCYNIITGTQTFTWDLKIDDTQSNLQGVIGCTAHSLVSEIGTGTHNYYASTLQITTTQLPNGTVGSTYPSPTLMATGGTPPYTWSVSGLPTGLAVDSKTGTISGTPATGGNLSVTVQVTDSVGSTASKALGLVIQTDVSVVANINSGPDQLTHGTASIDAHFSLGAMIQVGLEDQSRNPIASTVSLGPAVLAPGVDSVPIFPDIVIFQYSTAPPDRASFQAVQEGSVLLTLVPDPSSGFTSSVSLNVIVTDPFALGSGHSEVDELIYPLAHRTGVPPQYIKAQRAQEGMFNPQAYRYEPLAPYVGDYGVVSRNADCARHSFRHIGLAL